MDPEIVEYNDEWNENKNKELKDLQNKIEQIYNLLDMETYKYTNFSRLIRNILQK